MRHAARTSKLHETKLLQICDNLSAALAPQERCRARDPALFRVVSTTCAYRLTMDMDFKQRYEFSGLNFADGVQSRGPWTSSAW